MNARWLLLAALALVAARPASAHRLDEYLQATLIAVEKDRVRIDLYLTPGVAILPRVLAEIDRDGDGALSAAEREAYANQIVAELSLAVNGTRVSLRRTTAEFPKLDDMREGAGDIHLEFVAELPHGTGLRKLRWENRHQSTVALYQVNCLASRDPAIRIGSERRDFDQSVYELNYTQAD